MSPEPFTLSLQLLLFSWSFAGASIPASCRLKTFKVSVAPSIAFPSSRCNYSITYLKVPGPPKWTLHCSYSLCWDRCCAIIVSMLEIHVGLKMIWVLIRQAEADPGRWVSRPLPAGSTSALARSRGPRGTT